MNASRTDPPPLHLHTALAFEVGLGLLALLAAWPFRLQLTTALEFRWLLVGWGLLGTIPMLLLLSWLMISRFRPIVRLRVKVRRISGQLFVRQSSLDVGLVALAAGWGEELLFRGTIQGLLVRWTNPWIAIAGSSLLFGLVHALSVTYLLLAAGVGLYLGVLAWWTESLVPPIIAHALYDFVALSVMLRRRQPGGDA